MYVTMMMTDQIPLELPPLLNGEVAMMPHLVNGDAAQQVRTLREELMSDCGSGKHLPTNCVGNQSSVLWCASITRGKYFVLEFLYDILKYQKLWFENSTCELIQLVFLNQWKMCDLFFFFGSESF